jgi:hypothetical protein
VFSSFLGVLCVKAFEILRAKNLNTEDTEEKKRKPETP